MPESTRLPGNCSVSSRPACPAGDIPPKPAVKPAEAGLDEETQKFISQSLTDVDLFASYGLTQKAIGLLEAILRRAPRHTPTLEKLLDFVIGAGDDRRTAELAAKLERIHSDGGDQRSSERFGELRRRFQRAAGLTDEELALSVPAAKAAAPEAAEPAPIDGSIPEIAAEPAPEEPKPSPVPAPAAPVETTRPEPAEVTAPPVPADVQEVDLSDECATPSEETRPAGAVVEAPPPAPAKHAAAPTRHTKPGDVEKFQIGEPPPVVPPADVPAVAASDVAAASKIPAKPKQVPAAKAPQKPQQTSDLEFELEQEYELVLESEPLVPAYDQRPPEKPVAPPEPQRVGQNAAPAPPAGSGFASDQFLADLAHEIAQLGIGALAPEFSRTMPDAQPASLAKQQAAPAPTGH